MSGKNKSKSPPPPPPPPSKGGKTDRGEQADLAIAARRGGTDSGGAEGHNKPK